MVQFKFNPKEGIILPTCELVHKGKTVNVELVFDTGATTTIISWAIAEKLGLKPAQARNTIPFFSASGKVLAPIIKIDALKIGETIVKNLEVIIHDLPQESRVYGLLGMNFISNFEVRLDFKKGLVRLA